MRIKKDKKKKHCFLPSFVLVVVFETVHVNKVYLPSDKLSFCYKKKNTFVIR